MPNDEMEHLVGEPHIYLRAMNDGSLILNSTGYWTLTTIHDLDYDLNHILTLIICQKQLIAICVKSLH